MNIAIPLGGQIRMVICSSFVIAKRKDATHYDLSGESFQLTGVTADQVYVFDDSVVITEGMELTHDLIAQSLPPVSYTHLVLAASLHVKPSASRVLHRVKRKYPFAPGTRRKFRLFL